MVITGDLTQIDLPSQKESGLLLAKKALGAVKDSASMSSITMMWCVIRLLAELSAYQSSKLYI